MRFLKNDKQVEHFWNAEHVVRFIFELRLDLASRYYRSRHHRLKRIVRRQLDLVFTGSDFAQKRVRARHCFLKGSTKMQKLALMRNHFAADSTAEIIVQLLMSF